MAGAETGPTRAVEIDELWRPVDPAAVEEDAIAESHRILAEAEAEQAEAATIGDPTVRFGRGVLHEIGSRRQRIRDSIPGRAAREQAKEQAIAEAKALGQKGRVRELTAKKPPKKDEKFVPKPTGRYAGRCALGPGEAARILKEEHGIHDVHAQDLSLAEHQERIGFDEPEAQSA